MMQARSHANVTPSCAARSTRANPAKKVCDRNSIRSTLSAKPVKHILPAKKPEGWVLVPDRYDDGGISGGTLERPALQRLLADIEAGNGST